MNLIRIIHLGVMLTAFLTTFFLMKPFIKKARQKGFVAADMYKKDKPRIPTMGGLVILAGIMVSMIFAEFFSRLLTPFLIFYFIVFMFALYGLTDDLFGFKQKRFKVWILFLLALPIAILVTDTTLSLPFFELNLGWVYAFVFAPLYIMVVANLINMHSGYNGLSAGTTLIMLVFAAIKSYMTNNSYLLYILLPAIGAIAAFLYFNRHPSKVFLGNIGSFLIGSALGAYLVLSDIEFFGVIILIPHIINFLLWIYWCHNSEKYPYKKFAKLRKDGTIEAPNYLTLKFIVAKLFRTTEKQAVLICYGITIFFCIIGLIVG